MRYLKRIHHLAFTAQVSLLLGKQEKELGNKWHYYTFVA